MWFKVSAIKLHTMHGLVQNTRSEKIILNLNLTWRVNLFVTVSHSYGHDKIDNMIMITGKTLALTTCSKISTQTHKKHHFNLMGLTIKQKFQLSYLKIVFFHSNICCVCHRGMRTKLSMCEVNQGICKFLIGQIGIVTTDPGLPYILNVH